MSDDSIHRPLVHYYRDCLAAQFEWGRALNVLAQQDVFVVPLTAEQQHGLGRRGTLAFSDARGIELGKRHAIGGSGISLRLGALFLVGRTPETDDRPERRYCAPLLEVPLTLTRELDAGQVRIAPEEVEFAVNYGLLAELLADESDDLQDRLADLSELVPDFPIDADEFDAFWNGFRMIATDLPIVDELPEGGPKASSATVQESAGEGASQEAGHGLQIVDFYDPTIPEAIEFRLLPATAVLLSERSGSSATPLNELQAMAECDLRPTGFGAVFGVGASGGGSDGAPVDEPSASADDAFPLPLTEAQEGIVRSARTAPLTVVTGPPGTGKSYTITAVVLDALLRGESVLVASQMDKAVEVVTGMVERVAGRHAIARSGGRAAQRELAKRISELTGPQGGLEWVPPQRIAECERRLRTARERLRRLEQRFADVVGDEVEWSELKQSLARLEPTCPLPVHDVSPRHARKAVRAGESARYWLEGDSNWLARWWGGWQKSRAERLLRVRGAWSPTLDELDELLRVQQMRARKQEIEGRCRAPMSADLVWEEVERIERECLDASVELLRLRRTQRLFGLVSDREQRGQLRHLATLLRRRNRKAKRELRGLIDSDLFLTAFPAWASTNRALGEILPATPGLFDLVVVDESSQCDPALASVALMRGKRALVVGDPQQLRHVCFLSRAREQAAFAKYEVPPAAQEQYHYRRSLFDLAADAVAQERFFLLDQHFRSVPHIARFSNERFYQGRLRIMTARPRAAPEDAIEVVPASGRRKGKSSVNDREAEEILARVEQLVAETQDAPSPPSIGIVSPFRDHADAIGDRLVERLSASAIDRHGIVVGTAHSLQGDEKDLVFFTTSIDGDSHPASLRFLENAHVFNVAVTRARRQVIVVTSVAEEELPAGLLRDYLRHARTPEGTGRFGEPATELERSVSEALSRQGVESWTSFRAAGIRVPIVLLREAEHVAVLCDGLPQGPEGDGSPLSLQRILRRAGWRVHRVSERGWEQDWYACFRSLTGGGAGVPRSTLPKQPQRSRA